MSRAAPLLALCVGLRAAQAQTLSVAVPTKPNKVGVTEFVSLDASEAVTLHCQCIRGIEATLEKPSDGPIAKELSINLFEQDIPEDASNWTVWGTNYSQTYRADWFSVGSLTGDTTTPIMLTMTPSDLHERALDGVESGYQGYVFVEVSDRNGANAKNITISVKAGVVSETAGHNTVFGEVVSGGICAEAAFSNVSTFDAALNRFEVYVGETLPVAFSACDYDQLPVKHKIPNQERKKLPDGRRFRAKLANATSAVDTDVDNLVAVKHRVGGLYSASLVATAPGFFQLQLELGTDEDGFSSSTPATGLDIRVLCPAAHGLVEVFSDCLCMSGWQPLNWTGAVAGQGRVVGCELCPVGSFKTNVSNTACVLTSGGYFQEEAGSSIEKACAAGTYSPSPGAVECLPCAKGHHQPSTGQTECLPCAPGSFQSETGKSFCTLCYAGSAQPGVAQEECVECELYTNSTVGSAACTFCASNRQQRDAQVAAETALCEDCPNRATCPFNGTAGLLGTTLDLIEVDPQYWRLANLSRDIKPCSEYRGFSPCVGGQLLGVDGGGYCLPGYGGPLCAVCDDDYWGETRYFDDKYAECKRCQSSTYYVVLYVLLLSAPLLLVTVLWRLYKLRWPAGLAEWLDGMYRTWKGLSLETRLKQLIGFVQVVTVIGSTYSVPTPPVYKSLLIAVEWMYIDIFGELFIASECLGGYRALVLISSMFPIAVIIVFIILSISASLRQRKIRLAKPPPPPQIGGTGAARVSAVDAVELTIGGAIKQGLLKALPLSLVLIFLFCPSVSATIFEAMHCKAFSTDTDSLKNRYFLYNYPDIECYESQEYYSNLTLAWALIVVWPIGSLCLYATLLSRIRRAVIDHNPNALSRASAFMFRDYRSEVYYWEWFELLRKLVLTSFVLLVPENAAFIRLMVAVLFSLFFLLMQIVVRPYQNPSNGAISLACQVVVLVLYLGATYMKLFEEFSVLLEDRSAVESILTFQSVDQIALLCLGFIGMLIVLLIGMTWRQAHMEARFQILRLVGSNAIPDLSLAEGVKFHIFLSHVWASGQDQVAVMKRSLQRLLPSSSIFLDVDNLEDIGALETYIAESSVIMMFLSKGYFTSRNCLREVRASHEQQKPLVLVHESDPNKGGLTLPESRKECPDDARAFVFDDADGKPRPVIVWHRIYDFQMCSLKMIAVGLLKHSPAYAKRIKKLADKAKVLAPSEPRSNTEDDETPASTAPQEHKETDTLAVYMPGETRLDSLQFKAPICVYVSPNNPGAFAAAIELRDAMPAKQVLLRELTQDALQQLIGGGKDKGKAEFAESTEQMKAKNNFMLLYLNANTYLRAEGEAFAQEVRDLRKAKVPIVMLHENDPERDGCEFALFFQTTPPDLIDNGLYRALALAMYAGEHRQVSLRLVAMCFGAKKVKQKTTLNLVKQAKIKVSKGHAGAGTPGSVRPQAAEASSPADADAEERIFV